MTSPFIHDLKDQSKMYTSQYSFINDIVEPIWNVVISLLPQLQFALEQLDVNKDHYKSFFPPETVISNNNNHHHNKSPQKHSTTSSNKNTKSHNNQHHNTNTHTSSRAAKTATA